MLRFNSDDELRVQRLFRGRLRPVSVVAARPSTPKQLALKLLRKFHRFEHDRPVIVEAINRREHDAGA